MSSLLPSVEGRPSGGPVRTVKRPVGPGRGGGRDGGGGGSGRGWLPQAGLWSRRRIGETVTAGKQVVLVAVGQIAQKN